MSRKEKRKGFTLVELLSYFGLAALLLAIMFLFFNSVVKQYVFISERITIRKIGSLLIRSVKQDVESTTSAGIWAPENSSTILLQPIVSSLPPAQVTWSDSVISYRHYPGEHQVKRWQQPIRDINADPLKATAAHSFTPAQINAAPNPSPGIQARTWGTVDRFEVRKNFPSLTVEIELSLVDSKGHTHRHNLSQEIFMRNGESS